MKYNLNDYTITYWDAEYRGEVGVIIENTGNLTATISKGDKIAQMVIMPVPMIKWEEATELDKTSRGENGYGSTDKSWLFCQN